MRLGCRHCHGKSPTADAYIRPKRNLQKGMLYES